MSRRGWERAIWLVVSGVALIAARRIMRPDVNVTGDAIATRPHPPTVAAARTLVMFDDESLDSAVAQTVAHDVFRVERKPATVAYSLAPGGFIAPAMPAAPVVRISLQGTIGGPPWSAIISGIPGHDGTVVMSTGDTLGGVAIRHVGRDNVTVRVKDSTWTVTLGRAGA